MKRFYFLTILFAFIPYLSIAQGTAGAVNFDLQPTVGDLTQQHLVSALKKHKQQKAFKDTIFYEDFDQTSVNNNWTIVDNSGNSTPWVWAPANQAPGGMFSTNIGPLNSTTQSNGFMQLRADFYNTPLSISLVMDTYFQSAPIDLRDTNNLPRKAVEVSWEQSLRYCCRSNVELVLEVSTDGTNWTSFDARGGLEVNEISPNGQLVRINVSSVLANQDTGYVRFRSSINSHYYWMIDDLTIFEGPANNLEIDKPSITFHPNYPSKLQPQYYQVPLSNVPVLGFETIVLNGGGNTQTNAQLKVDVISDSLIGGGSGFGLQFSSTNLVGTTGSILPASLDTAILNNYFFPSHSSYYTIDYNVSSDSINQEPADANKQTPVALTLDSTIALERGELYFDRLAGPIYVGSGTGGPGDMIGALMVVDTGIGLVTPTSISYYVPSEAAISISGLQVSPRIWRVDTNCLFVNPSCPSGLDSALTLFLSSPNFYTVDTCTSTCLPNQASVMDEWVTLNFPNKLAMPAGVYYYGLEQTGGSAYLVGLGDKGAEKQSSAYTNIAYLSFWQAWQIADFVMGLRFNGIFPPPRSNSLIEESLNDDIDFKVYPNPNDGLFTIELNSPQTTTYQFNVRNMLGQTVLSETMNVNGSTVRQLDLSHYDKGVYFVSLENGDNKLVKKLLVK